jgi:hypothetical protein
LAAFFAFFSAQSLRVSGEDGEGEAGKKKQVRDGEKGRGKETEAKGDRGKPPLHRRVESTILNHQHARGEGAS